MGKLKFKTKQTMSDEVTFLATATADCPASGVTLAGSTTEELEGLADEIQTWSDGYNAEFSLTLGADFWASIASGEGRVYAIYGAALDDLEAAPNGVYDFCPIWSFENTSSNTADSSVFAAYFHPSAEVEANGIEFSTSDYANLYYDEDTGDDKVMYGYTTDPVAQAATEDLVEDSTIKMSFYMPKESDADGETDEEGDRLNVGDEVSMFAGFSAPVTGDQCGETMKLTMGAASLATGVAAAAGLLMNL